MNFPLEKYKYFSNNSGDVTAVSSYAGKFVKGYAKCSPSDNYDLEKGKKLAAYRCNYKVCSKRMKRAEKKLVEARKALEESKKILERAELYYGDSMTEFYDARKTLESFEESI